MVSTHERSIYDPKVTETNMPQARECHRALSRNSQEWFHIHTTGHVRHFCKFLHHTVQSRLSALQLMREVIQHAGEGEEEEKAGGEQNLVFAMDEVRSGPPSP